MALRKCSSVAVLSDDMIVKKKIYSIVSSADVSITLLEDPSSSLDPYELVFVTFNFVKHLKELKEKAVVVRPGENLIKMLDAGYEHFLFDPDSEGEILRLLYLHSKAERNVAVFGDFNMDFDRHCFLLNGREVYITRAEEEYLFARFINRKQMTDGRARLTLYRMRSKYGNKFLSRNTGAKK